MKRKKMFRLMSVILLSIILLLSVISIGFILYRDASVSPVLSRTQPKPETKSIEGPQVLASPGKKEADTKTENQKANTPILVNPTQIPGLSYALFYHNKPLTTYKPPGSSLFPDQYSNIDGVLTFRGNALRNSSSFGVSRIQTEKLHKIWEAKTGTSTWGGGAGWTGQPAIVKWPDDIKQMMNLKPEFKKKADFTEVVYASLDGSIYFLDLDTGKQTRPRISIRNPIKGSVTLDPRGYPLLYVGQGIPERGPIGYRIVSLIDQKLLYFIDGKDPLSLRGWGAFDSAPLINKDTDTMILGGENGMIYNIKLNTVFERDKKNIYVKPTITKYRYKIKGNHYQGIENSVAAYKNLIYFADNGGGIQCLDLMTMKPVWMLQGQDDTDATLTIEEEKGIPFIYTGSEVDKQGTNGFAYIRKINGITGKVVWEKKYRCMSLKGNRPVNGGMLATNVIGKKNSDNLVIFTLARYGKFDAGLMVALDKGTGEEIWKWQMPSYAWSSPVDFYNSNGRMYLLQSDSVGMMHLLDGKTGKKLYSLNLGANIEATPAIFNNTVVVATRAPKIFGIHIQ